MPAHVTHRAARDATPDASSVDDNDDAKPSSGKHQSLRRPSCLTILLACLAWSAVSYFFGTKFSQFSAPAVVAPQTLQQQQPTLQAASPPKIILPPMPPQPSPPPYRESVEMVAGPQDQPSRCLSFNREMCPPLNLSIQTQDQQRETSRFCGPFVKLERNFGTPTSPAARFCGKRLPRLNPCWVEAGVTSCLPHFFIVGEMKCGTTTLYHLLTKHPRIVVPRVKEPRFLQPGRFAQTTVSRYKYNFEAAATAEGARKDVVTFDASPVYLRSAAARGWLSRWMPRARMIALVRNPVQRSYSHWQMGQEWMDSKCMKPDQLATLQPLRPHITFEKLMERSLLVLMWGECVDELHRRRDPPIDRPAAPGGAFKLPLWLPEAEAVGVKRGDNDAAPLYQCLVHKDRGLVERFHAELMREWPAPDQRGALADASKLLGHCSEMMLYPPGALQKGSLYAESLEEWAKLFPRSQLKVVHTDDMELHAQEIMDETFDFLSMQRINVGNDTRVCVHGKSGVIDVLNAFEGSLKIGDTGSIPEPEKLSVARCESAKVTKGMHRDKRSGALHHDIEPQLLARLRAYYEPYNQRLYKFLGRDLGW